ncbi:MULTISPECIES: hypothetical protein, partial [unclassified Mesorhizobium]|uniref:hypothetical protein n=1 Tax=unclassified Mesorhizobium TaxID=325217 RepID=UPI001FEE5A05
KRTKLFAMSSHTCSRCPQSIQGGDQLSRRLSPIFSVVKAVPASSQAIHKTQYPCRSSQRLAVELAVLLHELEKSLGFFVTMLRRLNEPFGGFRVVWLAAYPAVVELGEVEFGTDISSAGRARVP